MSDEEMCEAYDLDPNGPDTFEACDRIEQLLRYRSMDYLERVDFDRQSARELDFVRERLFATQTEIWAYERGFEKLSDLAGKVNERLVTLGRFSLRLARLVALEVSDEFRAEHDLRDWTARLHDGDFDPADLIATVNQTSDDNPNAACSQAGLLMSGFYPFITRTVSDAYERFNGDLAAALIDRFDYPPDGRWACFRGFCAWIYPSADEIGSTQNEPIFFDVIGAPDGAPRWSSPPLDTFEQAQARFHSEVDAFWRQNPPMHPDNINAQ